MNGKYLALRINALTMGPIIAFREYIFRDVLPAFSNLDERAAQAEEEFYKLAGSLPCAEDGGPDIGDVADDARDHSYEWHGMMTSLRQTMVNLLAAGLFHLVEQQLASLSRDSLFEWYPAQTKLEVVAAWYIKHLHLDLKTLPSWATINELRLVANAVKHGEGSATNQLRAIRPEFFSNPAFAEIYKEYKEWGKREATKPICAPLSGEEFFVTEEQLRTYAASAQSFFSEIAGYLEAHY